MKRIIYKIIVFTLLLALLAPSLAGCARESDEAFLLIAEELLQKSATVNMICFGKGLSGTDEEEGYRLSGYLEVSADERQAYAVETVEDIRALAREVYTVAACDQIETVIFAPVQTESSYASFRRYFDAADGDVTHLMVKKDYTPLAVGEVTYQNLRISSHGRGRAEVLVDITVTEGSQTRKDQDVCLSLRYEDGAWKYDTLTYASIR